MCGASNQRFSYNLSIIYMYCVVREYGISWLGFGGSIEGALLRMGVYRGRDFVYGCWSLEKGEVLRCTYLFFGYLYYLYLCIYVRSLELMESGFNELWRLVRSGFLRTAEGKSSRLIFCIRVIRPSRVRSCVSPPSFILPPPPRLHLTPLPAATPHMLGMQ